MAKSMAVISDGTVANVIWCSDSQPETDTLKSPGERSVGIGDTYSDGKWYRDGEEILTPLESAQAEVQKLNAQLSELDAAYQKGVDSL